MFHIRYGRVRALAAAVLLALASLPASPAEDSLLPGTARLPTRSEIGLDAAEIAFLESHPVLRVMTDSNWPPLEFVDEKGVHQGVAIDILRDLETILGIRFDFPTAPAWAQGLAALEKGEMDMASSIVQTPNRAQYLDFTKPYLELDNIIFGGIQSPYIGDLRELQGKRVVVIKNYAVEEFLRRDYPELPLLSVPDTLTGVRLLARGEVDYFVSDMASAGYIIQRDSIFSIKTVGETPYLYSMSMAARKDLAPLASILDKALAAIPQEEMRRIRLSWYNAEVPRKADPRPYYIAAALLAALAIAVFAWIKTLQARVKARTAELAALNERLKAEVEERARTQEELQKNLAARELFLKELNHRIKNNLQVVLGLVRLSSTEAEDRGTSALEEAAGRIEAIARVHEQIEYSQRRGKQGDRVDLGDYLHELASGIGESLLDRTPVQVEVKAERGIEIGLKSAANLGIVVNELLMNARKYAFPSGREGRIEISLASPGEGMVRVTVADDGIGMAPDKPRRESSLGWTIIHSMAESLEGKLEVQTAPGAGTRWTLDFPLR